MRARVAASAGLIALVAIALAGCNFITPQATLVPYESSDGVSGTIGDVDVLNAVSSATTGSAATSSSPRSTPAPTTSTSRCSSSPAARRSPSTSTSRAAATGQFGFGDGGQVFLADIDTRPGGLLPIYFQYGDAQGRQLLVPVLDGGLAEYSGLLPTPTPTPTPTETPIPIETGAATDPAATPTPAP